MGTGSILNIKSGIKGKVFCFRVYATGVLCFCLVDRMMVRGSRELWDQLYVPPPCRRWDSTVFTKDLVYSGDTRNQSIHESISLLMHTNYTNLFRGVNMTEDFFFLKKFFFVETFILKHNRYLTPNFITTLRTQPWGWESNSRLQIS